MIARVYDSGRGFKGLMSYLVTGTDGRTRRQDRVEWMQFQNLPTRDPQVAACMMAATASSSVSNASKPLYHFSVSCDPDDPVDDEALRRIASRTVRELGLQEHEVAVFCHRDRSHPHLHFVVNRVHPERGTLWSPWRDYYRLEHSMRAQEKELGLRVVPGWLAPTPAGAELNLQHHGLEQEAPRKPAPGPRRGDAGFLQEVTQRAAPILEGAGSWAELDRRLAEQGLSLRVKGGGFRVTDGRHEVKASEVGRAFSRKNLEKRFGAYPDYRARMAVAADFPKPRVAEITPEITARELKSAPGEPQAVSAESSGSTLSGDDRAGALVATADVRNSTPSAAVATEKRDAGLPAEQLVLPFGTPPAAPSSPTFELVESDSDVAPPEQLDLLLGDTRSAPSRLPTAKHPVAGSPMAPRGQAQSSRDPVARTTPAPIRAPAAPLSEAGVAPATPALPPAPGRETAPALPAVPQAEVATPASPEPLTAASPQERTVRLELHRVRALMGEALAWQKALEEEQATREAVDDAAKHLSELQRLDRMVADNTRALRAALDGVFVDVGAAEVELHRYERKHGLAATRRALQSTPDRFGSLRGHFRAWYTLGPGSEAVGRVLQPLENALRSARHEPTQLELTAAAERKEATVRAYKKARDARQHLRWANECTDEAAGVLRPLLGEMPPEVIGRLLAELMPPDDREGAKLAAQILELAVALSRTRIQLTRNRDRGYGIDF